MSFGCVVGSGSFDVGQAGFALGIIGFVYVLTDHWMCWVNF